MIDLDQVVAMRAAEQVRAERIGGYQEKDSWAISGTEKRPTREPPRQRICRAPNCGRIARSTGYCHRCGRRVARDLPVDWDPSEPGRRPDARRTA